MLRSRFHSALVTTLFAAIPFTASAQFNSFFSFPATSAQPVGAPVLVNGIIYGVTYAGYGGSAACTPTTSCGSFFQLNKPATHGGPWTETVLYEFAGASQGGAPNANPIYLNGNFYGTTYAGGTGQGTFYEFIPNGSGGYTHQLIYSFLGGATDGGRPTYLAALNGNIYGIGTTGGTNNNGVVFQFTPSGSTFSESIIQNFTSASDGAQPQYILAYNGMLYVSLAQGGASNGGALVQLTPPATGTTWTEDVLYAFGRTGGAAFNPEGFTFGPDSNLYGVLQLGGPGACTIKSYNGCGGVYRLTNTAGATTWPYNQIYSFTGGSDGNAPFAPPAFSVNGNIFVSSTGLATTPVGSGAVIELTPNTLGYRESLIHTFNGTDGADPGGQLTFNPANGNMYGFTIHGGSAGDGTAYSVTTAAAP